MLVYHYDDSNELNAKRTKVRKNVELDLIALADLPEGAVVVGATMMKPAKNRVSRTLPRFEVNGVEYSTEISSVTRPIGYAYLGENQYIEIHRDLANASLFAMVLVAVLIGTLFSLCGLYY